MTVQEAIERLKFAVLATEYHSDFHKVLEVTIEAMEKQNPKKQKSIDDNTSHFKLSKTGFLNCVTTNKDIRYPIISLEDLEYCPRCGQKLDWSEEE